jgi:23S rRNA (adenine2503-C2)-methyltransferase
MGEPAYRGRQLFSAIYAERVRELASITPLPKAFREKLALEYVVSFHAIEKKFESCDGTIRYLLKLADGELIETVWMPEGDGSESDGDGAEDGGRAEDRPESVGAGEKDFERATICVSSQVGCLVNCQFCLTARLGFKRNLSAGEIVGQVLAVLAERGLEPRARRLNLVFMGMGEPFLNYENFMKAVRLLVEGVGMSAARMTVSTAGIVPRIADFGREAVRPRLAISLNASNDADRDRLMPINRKWKLAALLAAARAFPLRARERVTFEYVLLAGVNDAEQNAREVVALLAGLPAKVNLIALNPGPEIGFGTPEAERVARFQAVLVRAGIPAFVRRPRGRDIYAACGQLKKTVTLAG